MADVRVVLPQHLQSLARLPDREVAIVVDGAVTVRTILDAIEGRFPQLRGTIRDHAALPSSSGSTMPGKRRPFVRFFACEQDLSHEPPDAPLPDAVARGAEPLVIIGAIDPEDHFAIGHPGQRLQVLRQDDADIGHHAGTHCI